MWWDSLPSLAIIGVCLTGIPIWIYGSNKFFFGNGYKRSVLTADDVHHYLRDTRISGVQNPYKQKGLENIHTERKDSKTGV